MSEEQIMLKLEMYLVSLYHNKSIICMQRNFSNRPTNLCVKKKHDAANFPPVLWLWISGENCHYDPPLQNSTELLRK